MSFTTGNFTRFPFQDISKSYAIIVANTTGPYGNFSRSPLYSAVWDAYNLARTLTSSKMGIPVANVYCIIIGSTAASTTVINGKNLKQTVAVLTSGPMAGAKSNVIMVPSVVTFQSTVTTIVNRINANAPANVFLVISSHGGETSLATAEGYHQNVSLASVPLSAPTAAEETDGGVEFIEVPLSNSSSKYGVLFDDYLTKIFVENLDDRCKLLAFIDTCHAGGMLNLSYEPGKVDNLLLAELSSEKAICEAVCLSSCDDLESSYELSSASGYKVPCGTICYKFCKFVDSGSKNYFDIVEFIPVCRTFLNCASFAYQTLTIHSNYIEPYVTVDGIPSNDEIKTVSNTYTIGTTTVTVSITGNGVAITNAYEGTDLPSDAAITISSAGADIRGLPEKAVKEGEISTSSSLLIAGAVVVFILIIMGIFMYYHSKKLQKN